MSKIMCASPRCRTIIDKQIDGLRCQEHKHKKDTPRRKPLEHTKVGGSVVYSTKRWKVLSQKKLTVNPFCEKCWGAGREVVADVVDHIEEIQDNKSKAYTFSNLKSLCHSCHNQKTAKVSHDRKDAAHAKKMGLFVM